MELSRRSLLQGLTAAATPGARAGAATPGARATARPVRIGIVGGRFGATFQWHLHPGVKVAAVCDIRPDRLKRLAGVYQCGNTYASYDEMLRHKELDAVGVFTPAPLHCEMTLAALKAGKHAVSAVPAGMTEEELQRQLEAVQRTGLRYMMAETSYYLAPAITCREWSKAGKFGTIFYSEAEYHHEGLVPLMFEDNRPSWRHGLPPMLYPTHCTGLVVPVTGERLSEVTAIGWGDGHEILRKNAYKNPFWNETALFKTERGHASRVSVAWHLAAGGTERGSFYGDRMSYIMTRPEGSPNTVVSIERNGELVLDSNNYPQGQVKAQKFEQPDYFERLPEPLRIKSMHGGSHTFITHEFASAVLEDRHPEVNVWEAIAYTLPGIVAHQSALKGGERLKIRDYGKAEAKG